MGEGGYKETKISTNHLSIKIIYLSEIQNNSHAYNIEPLSFR